ncbi:MAG: hypothetical protein QGI60_05280 [archaeon]|nr:hypothetical protein [archaeon]
MRYFVFVSFVSNFENSSWSIEKGIAIIDPCTRKTYIQARMLKDRNAAPTPSAKIPMSPLIMNI